MKKVPAVIMVLTMLASGTFIAIYLDRWEWTRALFVTMIFVVAEIALASWLIIQRLQRLEARMDTRDERSEIFDQGVLLRLRQTRPEYDRFAWLRDSMNRTNVFITFVVGGGIVLSGIAWLIDKIAGQTVTANRENHLAHELRTIAFPDGHFVADEATLIAQEFPACDDTDLRLLVGDTRGITEVSAKPYIIGVLAVTAGLVGIGELADATLTTHVAMPANSSTVVVVHGSTVEEGEFALATGVESQVRFCQLEVGRNIGSEPLIPLDGDRFQFEFTPGLDDADKDQFKGCIGDIVIDHLQASVESFTLLNGP